jgi:hypothetical protein
VAQQFTAAGEPVGSLAVPDPITVPPVAPCGPFTPSCPGETQFDPAVAGLDDGGYVIAWTSEFRGGGTSGVYARRYAPDGTADGATALVAATGGRAAVSAVGGGGFVVVWDAFVDVASSVDVFARQYGSRALMAPSVP